jgi:hypothetical protein
VGCKFISRSQRSEREQVEVDLSSLLRKESWSLGKESYVRSSTQRNTRWSVAHIAKALANHPMVKKESKSAGNVEASGGLRKEKERIKVRGEPCRPILIHAVIVTISSKPAVHGHTTNRKREKSSTRIYLMHL